MDKVIQLQDSSGNLLYPQIIDNIREPKQFDACFGAHRGLSGDYPENTMPAFIAAVKNGFRYIETDVVQSSDGVQFCLHDSTIDRVSNGTGTVSNMSASQLRQYDYGYPSKFGNKFENTEIVELKDFLLFCKRTHCIAELDLADDTRYNDSYLQNTYDIVKKCGMLNDTFFTANLTRLQILLAIDDTVMVSVSGMTSTSAQNNAVAAISNSRWATFSSNYDYVTNQLVENAHNLNVPIKVWFTENDHNDTAANADSLFDMGVDFIITDYVTPNAFEFLKQ